MFSSVITNNNIILGCLFTLLNKIKRIGKERANLGNIIAILILGKRTNGLQYLIHNKLTLQLICTMLKDSLQYQVQCKRLTEVRQKTTSSNG